MTNQNKKEKLRDKVEWIKYFPDRWNINNRWDIYKADGVIYDTEKALDIPKWIFELRDSLLSQDTPPSKSSSWGDELKSYMVDLIDEYFPKDNQDNPELPSTTHRSEAMASHALFLIKFKEVFASEIADERERVLKERDNYWQKIMENTCIVGRNFPARCYECGEKHASGMSWEEAYKANALFAKCFKCLSRQANLSN